MTVVPFQSLISAFVPISEFFTFFYKPPIYEKSYKPYKSYNLTNLTTLQPIRRRMSYNVSTHFVRPANARRRRSAEVHPVVNPGPLRYKSVESRRRRSADTNQSSVAAVPIHCAPAYPLHLPLTQQSLNRIV